MSSTITTRQVNFGCARVTVPSNIHRVTQYIIAGVVIAFLISLVVGLGIALGRSFCSTSNLDAFVEHAKEMMDKGNSTTGATTDEEDEEKVLDEDSYRQQLADLTSNSCDRLQGTSTAMFELIAILYCEYMAIKKLISLLRKVAGELMEALKHPSPPEPMQEL